MVLRFTVDDFRNCCPEAAGAGTARPSSRQLGDWLSGETAISAALYALRDVPLAQEDKRLRLIIANFMALPRVCGRTDPPCTAR
jgi:hypothetical protein